MSQQGRGLQGSDEVLPEGVTLLRRLFETASDAIVVLNCEGCIVLVDPDCDKKGGPCDAP